MAKNRKSLIKNNVDKFKRDTEGMTSSQKIEYFGLSDSDKEKFVNKFRNEHELKINNSNDFKQKQKSSDKSNIKKKEREKGLRTERIWVKGNDDISNECIHSNDLRNAAQYFERENYFHN